MKRILLLSLSLLLITSCGDTKNADTKNGETSSIENDTEVSAKQTQKLNMLVDAFNSFSSSSYKSYRDYTQSFGDDPSEFKSLKTWYRGGKINEYNVKKAEGLTAATKVNVYQELDSMILAYKANAEALVKVLNQSYSYYDMEDYKSDDFAKARSFHKTTLDAYDAFFTVDDMLRKKTDNIQSELEIISLNKMKANGETLNYLIGMSINTSTKVLNVAQSTEYDNLSIEELEAAHTNVRGILDELTQFKNDKPDEFSANHRMSWFYTSFKDFVKASKALINRKKENDPFSSTEKGWLNTSSGWMVKGSPDQVLNKYNDLVDKYNTMIN